MGWADSAGRGGGAGISDSGLGGGLNDAVGDPAGRMSFDRAMGAAADGQLRAADAAPGTPSTLDGKIDAAVRSIDARRFGQDSIHLARAEIRDLPTGSMIDIKPEQDLMKGLPNLSVPNIVGADGFGRGMWQHDYLVVREAPSTLTGQKGLEAVGKALIETPTPGASKPATAGGTLNDVGDLAPLDGDTNMVRSFVVKSELPNRSDVVINYTVDGEHILNEGFVMRYAELGANGRVSLITYGEGNALPQVEALEGLVWGNAVEKVWGDNASIIFNKAQDALR